MMSEEDQKSEISITQVMGGMKETQETGEYPDYYNVRSRKYKKTWRVNSLPAELKYKGEVVYTINRDEMVFDEKGKHRQDILVGIEMRD
ncbi:hypothetical protein ACKGJO_10870 [Gracilimonas sp. Q87]|uniref:hypothetical protein n=1 Tax=Gracilimonas sp. Q87 TaxID=3384766 RepID=UPI003983F75A